MSGLDPIWTQLGQFRDFFAQIFHLRVAVNGRGGAHVAVAEQALHAMRVDAGAREGSVQDLLRVRFG